MADPTTTPEQSSTGTESPATPLPPSEYPQSEDLASREDLLLAYDRLDREVRDLADKWAAEAATLAVADPLNLVRANTILRAALTLREVLVP